MKKKQRGAITPAGFAKLRQVRIKSSAGPCLTGYGLIRRNKVTSVVAHRNGRDYAIRIVNSVLVHSDMCPSCLGFPGGATYLNSYMD